MAFNGSSLATLAQATYKYVQSQGFDADDMFQRAGLDPEDAFNADARFPVFAMQRLWKIASLEMKRPSLVYDIVQQIEPTMLHAIGHAWIVSRNLLEALRRCVRYHRLLSTNMEIRLEAAQGSWQLVGNVIETNDAVPSEAVLAFCLQMCREAYGDDLRPMQVQLEQPKPANEIPLRTFYRCPIDYDRTENVIVFSANDLRRKLSGANAHIAAAMDEVTTQYLARMDKNDIVNQVRRIVSKNLVHGEPAKQEIADRLNLSPRTLQRILEKSGSSISQIVDETRHQLAVEFLAQSHYSIKGVAFELGFSDSANFSRAFRRWENTSPKAFRRNI